MSRWDLLAQGVGKHAWATYQIKEEQEKQGPSEEQEKPGPSGTELEVGFHQDSLPISVAQHHFF